MAITREDLVGWLVREHGLAEAELADDTPLFSSARLDSHAMVDLLGFLETATGRAPRWMDVNLENMDSVARILAYANKGSTHPEGS